MENNQAHDSRLDTSSLKDQRAMENNDWEKEFEEKYWPHNEDNDWGIDVSTFYEIKSFIRETRLSAFQEGLEEGLTFALNIAKEMREEGDGDLRGMIYQITSRIEESKKGKV